jgi:hypothetical protein
MSTIEIHIDELVLHGFSPHERARIGDAVERTLVDRLSTVSLATADAATDRVDAGSITIASGSSTSAIGGAIAGAIATAVGRVR